MSGQTAFGKPVGPASVCRGGKSEIRQIQEIEETELNGVEEREYRMSEDAGDEVEGEGELALPDWRVKAGPRNKPTEKEREEHEAIHVTSREGCRHCVVGRGRTHHHVTKRKIEDRSRRPTIAKDCNFMKTNSVVHARTISARVLR